MTISQLLCCLFACVALAATGATEAAERAGQALPGSDASGQTNLWQAAWRRASQVESAIDAGRTKVELAFLAASAGCDEAVTRWAEEEAEAWVKGGLWAAAAASSALGERTEQAEARLGAAQRLYARENEWRRALMERAVNRGAAAVALLSKEGGQPDLEGLRLWVEGEPRERAHPAAWVCAEWVVRHAGEKQDRTRTVSTVEVARAALGYAERLRPLDQASVVARVSCAQGCGGVSGDVRSCVNRWLGQAEAEAVPLDHFEVLAHAAKVCANAGEPERGRSLLGLALDRARRGQTGDAKAPWALLADAHSALGGTSESVWKMWQEGLARAGERPGYHMQVAAVLTMGGLAASAQEWRESDTRAACQANGSAALPPRLGDR